MRDKDWVHKEDVVRICASTMGKDAIHPCQYEVRCVSCAKSISPLFPSRVAAQVWLWDNRRAQEEVFGRTLCDACITTLLNRLEGVKV